MTKAVLQTIALMTAAVPGFATAQTLVDSTPYVVQANKYPYTLYPSSYMMDDHYAWETPTYAFNPNKDYTLGEQYTIIQDETVRTGGSRYYDWADGSEVINIEQAIIPEAYLHLVPPPTEILPWTNPVQTFNKVYSRNEKLGNNIFGAGYSINASITAETATATAEKRVEALAEGKIYGVAFSYEQELVRGRAYVSGQQGGANSGTAALYAMGQQIWSTNLYATYEPPPIDWSRTFFSASKTFMVGPVPISVKASLSGGVRLAVKGEIGPTIARLTATPGGWSNATASASVDIIIVAFGVEGSLSLINTTLPSRGELFWPFCTLDWTLKSDLNLNALSGNLKLFAKVKFLFFKKTWWVTIADWAGINRNWVLLNMYDSHNLGVCG